MLINGTMVIISFEGIQQRNNSISYFIVDLYEIININIIGFTSFSFFFF